MTLLKTTKFLLTLLPVLFFAGDLRAETKCGLQFTLDTRGMFFTRGKGEGTITCDNGQTASVSLRTDAGWITLFRKKKIDGKGTFSAVKDMQDLFGRYVDFEDTAGATSEKTTTPVVWKRNISLTFSRTPKNWNPGASLGEFYILAEEKSGATALQANPQSGTTETECQIAFHLKTHAELMESGKGEGTITCDNGASLPVIIKTGGSWIAVSRHKNIDGKGTFSKIADVQKLMGAYTPTRVDRIQEGPGPDNTLWHKDISLTFDVPEGEKPDYARGQFRILPASKK